MSKEEIKIPTGWELIKLGEYSNIIRGSSPRPAGDPLFFGGDIPWIKISDITASKGKYLFSTKNGLTSQGVLKSRFLKSGSLILTTSMLIAMPKILKIDGCIHDGFLAVLDIDKKIYREFLYYYFLNYRGIIEKENVEGTAIKNINTEVVKNLNVPLPSMIIQKQIVAKLDHILGEFEVKKMQIISLIEQNKERIDFFEKNWFKFLILNEFEKFSKLPEWKLEKLITVTTIGQGGTPSRSNLDYWNGDIPWLSSGEMRNNIITNSKEKITKLGLEKSSTKLCPIGTVMIAMTGQGLTRGRTSLLQIEACANQSCAHIIIQDQNNLLPEFLWFYLQSQYWKIRSVYHGSGQPGINTSTIKSWNIPLPPISIQKQIVQNIKSAEEKFQSQKKQFENIKNNYESKIKYINHIQSSVLDSAFSGKLLN